MNYSCLRIKFLWKYLNLKMVMLIEPFGMLYNDELCYIHESFVWCWDGEMQKGVYGGDVDEIHMQGMHTEFQCINLWGSVCSEKIVSLHNNTTDNICSFMVLGFVSLLVPVCKHSTVISCCDPIQLLQEPLQQKAIWILCPRSSSLPPFGIQFNLQTLN